MSESDAVLNPFPNDSDVMAVGTGQFQKHRGGDSKGQSS